MPPAGKSPAYWRSKLRSANPVPISTSPAIAANATCRTGVSHPVSIARRIRYEAASANATAPPQPKMLVTSAGWSCGSGRGAGTRFRLLRCASRY
jgi:hypothetical protein